jgi:hypothetical protein
MQRSLFQTMFRRAAMGGVALLLATGCNKKADNTINYKSAINSYYSAHPVCLFPEAVKFPVQVATSDASKTAPYDALVDQRLLVRTSAEKKIVILSKQENNYDLSNEGRDAWTADTSQPGYGNFCYGHRSVSSIDNSTPTSSDPGATTQVSYHYSVSDAPSWATAAETKTAFPNVQANLSGPQTATAALTNTSNGWQVSSTQDPDGSHAPATSADGKVVQ